MSTLTHAPDQDVRDRDGRVLGRDGRATRARLLEALRRRIDSGSWRALTAAEVARDAITSPPTFWAYWRSVEAAVVDLAGELVDRGEQFSDRLSAVLWLLELDGYRVPAAARLARDEAGVTS